MRSSSFLFLAANTPWVYALARSLADHNHVTAVRFYDWANKRRLSPQWPETESSVRRVMFSMPPGYAGRLEPAFRLLVRGLINSERIYLRRASGAEPIVICPYPYLAPWVRGIPGDRLVYYNLDDYALYDPSRVDRTRRLEDELVDRSCLTVCLSVHQVAALKARNPKHADRIEHFPLGVVQSYLNPAPQSSPLSGTIGYIGNLTDRVDWAFVTAVAEQLPEAIFHFVGRLDTPAAGSRDTKWEERRRYALGLPNVIYEGAVPQANVRDHYWRYSVNWMPYDVKHAFNVASCPTKIMDAFASGRPFVSTDIPEVRLYPGRIHLAGSPAEASSILRDLISGSLSHDAREQVAFAASQTWPRRAQRFRELLNAVQPPIYVAAGPTSEAVRACR